MLACGSLSGCCIGLLITIHVDGSPLALDELLATPLFRKDCLPNVSDATPFGLMDSNATMSLLSQGEHPVLGTPSWYLHPCHTSEMIEEVMAELRREDWSPEQIKWHFFQTWFMILGNVVDLRFPAVP